MRSNYNPHPQRDPAEFQQTLTKLAVYEEEIVKATERLNQFLTDHLPGLLRHHADMRILLRGRLADLRSNLQTTNNNRAAHADSIYRSTMAEIESLRSQHHFQESKARAKARREQEEKASVTVDPATQQWSYIKQEEYLEDGIVKYRQRQVLLQPTHPWVLAKSSGR